MNKPTEKNVASIYIDAPSVAVLSKLSSLFFSGWW